VPEELLRVLPHETEQHGLLRTTRDVGRRKARHPRPPCPPRASSLSPASPAFLRAATATVVLFVAAHVLTFAPNGTPALDLQPASVLSLAVFGFACTHARVRSASVWAAVLVHNLANLSLVLSARGG
jgi:hypothetical protein